MRISFVVRAVRRIAPAVVPLTSWPIGLLVAAWLVPGVSLSAFGFTLATVAFLVAQTVLSLAAAQLPHQYASLFLGGTGLALTIVALILASIPTRGIIIDGTAAWLATTVLAWLVTTIGAIALPGLLIGDGVQESEDPGPYQDSTPRQSRL
ncbi:hypothetical protein hbim_02066 [Mycolicibacterium mageritense]|uniref:Phage holin family protein n=1 Tax=Mycolicibacterium mageritense TaxID=53462 RepID=A0AAI8XMP4_MYCME|nr:hypothetical protein hbim_02066 [Mycolicibacterium mageritense]